MFTPSVNIHTHSCCGSLCSGIAAYSSCATTSMIESAPPCRVVQTRRLLRHEQNEAEQSRVDLAGDAADTLLRVLMGSASSNDRAGEPNCLQWNGHGSKRPCVGHCKCFQEGERHCRCLTCSPNTGGGEQEQTWCDCECKKNDPPSAALPLIT